MLDDAEQLIEMLADCIHLCNARAWRSELDNPSREELEKRLNDILRMTRDSIADIHAYQTR